MLWRWQRWRRAAEESEFGFDRSYVMINTGGGDGGDGEGSDAGG